MELILLILAWFFGIVLVLLAIVGFFAILLLCGIIDELTKYTPFK